MASDYQQYFYTSLRFRPLPCLKRRATWDDLKLTLESGDNDGHQIAELWLAKLQPLLAGQDLPVLSRFSSEYGIKLGEKLLYFADHTFTDNLFRTPDIDIRAVGPWKLQELLPYVKAFEEVLEEHLQERSVDSAIELKKKNELNI